MNDAETRLAERLATDLERVLGTGRHGPVQRGSVRW
jgi:hypothetical protein